MKSTNYNPKFAGLKITIQTPYMPAKGEAVEVKIVRRLLENRVLGTSDFAFFVEINGRQYSAYYDVARAKYDARSLVALFSKRVAA